MPRLRRYARPVISDTGSAGDLVQTTLERALSHWHPFDQRRKDPQGRARLRPAGVSSDVSQHLRVGSRVANGAGLASPETALGFAEPDSAPG